MVKTHQGSVTHTWEATKADANWASINEDEEGNLIASHSSSQSLADQIRQRRKRLIQLDHAQSSKRILRDMIRYLYVVVDLSEAMYEKDAGLGYGPNQTRLNVLLNLLDKFAQEYYDQNPLSHLGLVVCKNGEAEVLSLLTGSKRSTLTAIGALKEGVSSGLISKNFGKDAGEFSLQNGIEVAGRSLGHMPKHGSREILVMVGSLSTCDPGDVLVDSLPRLINARIRVSCVAMCAEMHICRKISEASGGVMGVALDGRHLQDLLMNFVAPPPALKKDNEDDDHLTCDFVAMGFPKRTTEDFPTLMHTVSSTGSGSVTRDNKLFFGRTAYECPRCKAKAAELPCDCAVCGLKLVLAPHLARSFHHLFPVPPFEEVLESTQIASLDVDKSSVKVLPPITSSSCYSFDPPAKLGFQSDDKEMKQIDIDSYLLLSSKDCDRVCFSCLKVIGVRKIVNSKAKKGKPSKKILEEDGADSLRFECPDCKNIFCSDCDEFLHETLHNCPGCLCR
ncbi:transcription initiation factor TFIIH subunit 2 [Chaetoceros tenuissimus]|uniref:General transcription factor IIH subunit n=1 Tax=Chaetoceros tenuissimus TaxID=426638 RepID=A0AAD3H9V2_9STRA|nr:transcription initiation factor TFIIH subunit 2 [Chaetoceros tenuissimus]